MLTDYEIDCIGAQRAPYTDFQFARAIESAATAPLLAEIERLKERVKELEAQAAQEPVTKEMWRRLAESQAALLQVQEKLIQQEEPRHLWDGSHLPNYTITREQ